VNPILCRWRWLVVCRVVQHSTAKIASEIKKIVDLLIVVALTCLWVMLPNEKIVAAQTKLRLWIGRSGPKDQDILACTVKSVKSLQSVVDQSARARYATKKVSFDKLHAEISVIECSSS
jgi:hypothetical protein